MNILIIGDIVGEPGRNAVQILLPLLKQRERIDFVIGNAENAAGGSGITPRVFQELKRAGLDVVTSGDHVFKKKEVLEIINAEPTLLRPLNYPPDVPGKGTAIVPAANGVRVGVVNLAGRVFMDCPFRAGKAALEELRQQTPIAIVDVHAEATSEKIALGWYVNGLASAVVGTHTHVQTADERLLPPQRTTAFITDIGMTGGIDSVIGRKTEQILKRFLTRTPLHFEVADENVQLQGVIVDIDEMTGAARSIRRIQESCPRR
jgi:hypothetical protein